MPKHNGARPSSDELVDLHISVVPPEYWMERLNYASQKVIGDTFSAGFIRVHPGKTIAQLRKDITEQIGTEFFPENYVFLKHVGRCLALVREKQEFHLKVKNFVPPQSSLPEMFVLPARPTMYSHSVLPPIRPNMVDVARMTQDGQLRNGSPSESSQKNSALSSHSSHFEGSFLPNSTPGRSHDLPTNTPKPETAGSPDELKRLVTGNSTTGHRDSARNRPIVTQLHQEARPNKELPPVSPKKVPITQVGQKRKSTPLETEGASATHDAKKTPRVKSVLHEGPQTQKVRYNIPSHGNSDSDYAEFNAGSGHNEVDMKDDTPTKLTHHPNPPISNPDSTTFAEENPLKTIDTRNPDDDQNMDSPLSTEYTEKMDENSPDIVDEIIDTSPEYEPRLYDGTNPTYPPDPSFLPPQPQPLPNAPMNTPDTVRTLSQSKQKTTSAASKNTSQGSGVPVKSSSNNDSGFTDHDDQYGEKHGFMDGSENGIHFPTDMDHARSDNGGREEAHSMRAPPIKNEPRSKISTFSKLPAETEHSASERIASLKKNMAINGKIVGEDHSDLSQKARLWHELQQARERRRAHEKERQDLVKKAKSMAMQINQQRNSVRDIWKRRYFEEKKKTSTLTELCLKLNSRLNGMQKKIVSSYELFKSSENRPPVFAGIRDRPSNKTNSKIAATKLQHSIDDLKRKLNDAKVKLTGEVKLRHQAEQDLKLMRHELLTKKIQSHAAYRKISRSRVFLRSSRLLTAQR